MPDLTTNYGLIKPLSNETADIQDINDNMDVLDTKLKEVDNKASNITVPVTSVNTKTGAVVLSASDILTTSGSSVESSLAEKATKTEVADIVAKEIDYAVASGTNTYTSTIADTTLVEGRSYKIKFTNANSGASTLNINNLGAKTIQKGNGNALASGNIKAGQIVHLVYTGSVFQLLGEGGEYGTATKNQVLNTHTIATEAGGIEQGLIPVNASQTATLNITGSAKPTKVVPSGYTPGGTITAQLDASLANLILQGNTIGGVAGTLVKGKGYATGTIPQKMYEAGFDTGGINSYTVSSLGFIPKKIITYSGFSGSVVESCSSLKATTGDGSTAWIKQFYGNNVGVYVANEPSSDTFTLVPTPSRVFQNIRWEAYE